MLNPEQDLDLSYFVLHLAHHPHAKKILNSVLKNSGGTKVCSRLILLVALLVEVGIKCSRVDSQLSPPSPPIC